jgi:SAM-dependent methyltransferase
MIRKFLKDTLPAPVSDVLRRGDRAVYQIGQSLRRRYQRERNRARSAEDVFTEIYQKNFWGGRNGEFYSGIGSRYEQADLYANAIIAFITKNEISSVVDLGCGDFEIGRRIAGACNRYVGVDIVREVVENNNRLFASDRIWFVKADISNDDLPDGDLCLARQVFQHLSNQQIARALTKLRKYRFLIVTEEQPDDPKKFNVDKIHGADTRVGSGVYLEQPPFNVANLTKLLETRQTMPNEKGEIITWGGILRTFQVTV